MIYANEFKEILPALSDNVQLKARILILAKTRPLCCKVVEEPERAEKFRAILVNLIEGDIAELEEAYKEVELMIPRGLSKYCGNSEIFVDGWNEKVVRMHLSRFYNHAVLDLLSEKGDISCFIPEAAHAESNCTLKANEIYEIKELLDNIIKCYDWGQQEILLKVPEGPQCPHVVKPLECMSEWHLGGV